METWQSDWLIDEWRQVPLQGLPPGDYRLTIGVYSRVTGVRYPTLARDGIRVLDEERVLTTLTAGPAVASW
jgi:hypothetical protein